MNEQIEAVHRMQNYIAQHLGDKITLADLSKFHSIHLGIHTNYLSIFLIFRLQTIFANFDFQIQR